MQISVIAPKTGESGELLHLRSSRPGDFRSCKAIGPLSLYLSVMRHTLKWNLNFKLVELELPAVQTVELKMLISLTRTLFMNHKLGIRKL